MASNQRLPFTQVVFLVRLARVDRGERVCKSLHHASVVSLPQCSYLLAIHHDYRRHATTDDLTAKQFRNVRMAVHHVWYMGFFNHNSPE